MTAARRRLVWFGAFVAVGLTGFYGLRFLPFFSVRRIEVVGLRHLDGESVIRALEIASDHNLFEDLTEISARARSVPGVTTAEVRRRLPGTLRIAVRERIPVALLAHPDGLVPLAASGESLPFDPMVSGMSLPIVVTTDSTVLRVLSMVRAMDFTFFDLVDAALLDGDAVALRSGTRTISVRAGVAAEDLTALRAVRQDLTERAESFRNIDGRYDGWFVVRREGV